MDSQEKRKFIPISRRKEIEQLDSSLLKLWDANPQDWLSFGHIVRQLARQGIKKHVVVRALGRHLREMKLEKQRLGRSSSYRPTAQPKMFDGIQYTTELHSRTKPLGMSYNWDVGGFVTRTTSGTIVGFPNLEELSLPQKHEFALQTILVRMSEMYKALMDLRDIVVLSRNGVNPGFTDTLIREILFGNFVRDLNQQRSDTMSLIDRLAPLMRYPEELRKLGQSEGSDHDPSSLSNTLASTRLTRSFESIINEKKTLRKEGFDTDKYSLTELARKLKTIDEKIDGYVSATIENAPPIDPADPTIQEVPIPKHVYEQESLIASAYVVKIAELFSSLGLTEMQDMALVITSNYNAMDTQTTSEHILYDFIQGVKQFSNEIEGLSQEDKAKYFGRSFGQTYWRIPADEIKALEHQPWLRQEMGDHVGSFLREYSSSRIREMRAERKLEL